MSLRSALLTALCCTTLAAPAMAAQPNFLKKIEHFVIIYGENRSFDNLYGYFEGAEGLRNASYPPQVGLDGKPLTVLPRVWGAKHGQPYYLDPRFPDNLPNKPYRIDEAPVNLDLATITPDLVHKFYQNQMQINGGRNDRFAAISDAGALSMGHYDGSRLPMWKIAKEFTLADHFFMAAFGGSYLNHQWLICACTPVFPDAPASIRINLGPNNELVLLENDPSKGPPVFSDGNVTADGYAVNTMQPPYQPSGAKPQADNPQLAVAGPTTLPPQTQKTIGDALTEGRVTWKWYSKGWNETVKDRRHVYDEEGPVNFHPHHQPFNYYANYAPGKPARAEHLKDYNDLLADLAKGKLPKVSFYKPNGKLNEHSGYANVMDGDQHIAELVGKLRKSKQWSKMAIIVTYDENGGIWDHVPPPTGDRFGPGNRIPAIIISPYAKKNHVEHTPYDTTSILKMLTKRFNLNPLQGIRPNAGDLGEAFLPSASQ